MRILSGILAVIGATRLRAELKSCDFESQLNTQITYEQEASQFYLELSYQFKKESNYRPNVAKFFEARSGEERTHATLLAQFQNERGVDLKFNTIRSGREQLKDICEDENVPCHMENPTVLQAFDAVIAKEKMLTRNLDAILKEAEDGCSYNNKCVLSCSSDMQKDILVSGPDVKTYKEKMNEAYMGRATCDAEKTWCQAPHIADLITSTFLPEQYKDIHELRQLRGMLAPMVENADNAQRVFHELFFDSKLL